MVPSKSFTFRNANFVPPISVAPYPGHSDLLTTSKTSESPTESTISLRSAFNATAPANHLPAELVAKILTSDVWHYWWEVIPLTHICRHWRRVAIGTPQLWAQAVLFATEFLSLTSSTLRWCPFQILPMLLARSAPCPLRFDLPDTPCLTALVQQDAIVNPHFSRLAHLSVEVKSGDDVAAVSRVVLSHLRNLESLHMTEVNRGGRRSDSPISTNELPSWDDMELPHLHTLTIPGLCFTRAIAVASLRTISLSDGPRSHDIFLSALDRCSLALESLTLHRWVHPDLVVADAPGSRITRVVPLPNLRRLEIQLEYKYRDKRSPALLFAGLSLPPRVAINIDWNCNPENTRELLRKHLSELQFDSVSLHLSRPPRRASIHCYVGDTELLCVRAQPALDPRERNPQSFITKFLEDHRYPTATQLAVYLDVLLWAECTSLVQDHILRQFVAAFPNLRRLDLLGRSIGRAKFAMAKAFLDLPHPAGNRPASRGASTLKTLGYVCDVSEQQKAQNPIGFVDVLRAQLDALEALLADSVAAGGSRLHRLELCVVYTSLRQPHAPPEAYPYVYEVAASTDLTSYVSSTYLPRFGRLVDEVVFVGDVKRRGPGYRILTGATRRVVVPKRLQASRGGIGGRSTRKGW
ncbi:hypothetical protein GSI_13380 [Ganoderma sinense ZZ0214-1]|uniref:Uncharacterized protein n=1 Tax=Ganoderma sinense ZZ0214-1 TaxID=1077348 RepID=A0A2G8RVE7_9APHY|nr:hypothetical protein GSI_13380 [Ganoderma sinense ZZ0214-1]